MTACTYYPVPPHSGYRLTFFSDIDVSELTACTFPALASLLRLVMKYKIERPQKAIFELLSCEWPSTLEEYDEKMAAERTAIAAEGAGPEGYTVIHPATVISLLRECGYLSADLLAPLFYELSKHIWQFGQPSSPYHLDGLSLSDIQRFIVGVNKLRALHVREARCPMGVVPHQTCRSGLAVGWRGEAYNILHFQGNDMCRPLESWAALIAKTKLLSQPGEASASRAVPNEHPGPAAPPPYNANPGGGADQHWPAGNAAHGIFAVPGGLLRRALPVYPTHDHYLPAAQQYGAQPQAFNGLAQGYPAQQALLAPLAPPPVPMANAYHYHQFPGPGPTLRFVQQPQAQPQAQAPQPLFENLCGSCRQSIIQSMEVSRQKIWDSLPELFDLL
jgi:hypothetical protein